MPRVAVVITSAPGFGELLQQSLEEQGFTVSVVTANTEPSQAGPAPALLLIDGDAVPAARLADLYAAWRAYAPDAKVIVFPSESWREQDIEALAADHVLSKPFYLPDLFASIEALCSEKPAADKKAEAEELAKTAVQGAKTDEKVPVTSAASDLPPNPPWLADVNLAAQHLTRLSLETAAQAAALVTRQGQLWAYAGALPQPAAEELAQTVAHHWNADGGQDFARFLHLEAVQRDFLLYATGVTTHLILALLFDAQVPFTQMREQATRLARALTQEAPLPAPSLEENRPSSAPEATLVAMSEVAGEENGTMEENVWIPEEALPLPWEEDLPPEALEPLFDDVPPPQPKDVSSSPESSFFGLEEGEVSPTAPTRPVSLAELMAALQTDVSLGVAEDESATLPPHATLARAELTYACVLVPRFPHHHLTGDLARDLSRWMPTIATAHGWRLLHLAVRPNYLQWVVQVLPENAPAEIVRAVRKHTSQRIFAAYPRFREEALADDFWAPGYLVLSQPQPVPTPTIEAFIRQTRRRQGFV